MCCLGSQYGSSTSGRGIVCLFGARRRQSSSTAAEDGPTWVAGAVGNAGGSSRVGDTGDKGGGGTVRNLGALSMDGGQEVAYVEEGDMA